MPSKPIISVIMSAYNAEKYISESIESILSQTITNFELIIVNDASTDKTQDLIQQYALRDGRIVIINNPKNLYATASRNCALRRARGNFIAIHDADDVSFSHRFKTQLEYLNNNPDIFLVGSAAVIIDEDGNKITESKVVQSPFLIRILMRWNNCIFHSSVMFRNENILYREKMYNSEDYDYFLILLSSNKKLSNISNPLISYRRVSTSVSHSKVLQQMLYAQKAREFFEERSLNGKDSYDKFNSSSIEIVEREAVNGELIHREVLSFQIKSYFHGGSYIKLRAACLVYFKYFGYTGKPSLYFLISFLKKVRNIS